MTKKLCILLIFVLLVTTMFTIFTGCEPTQQPCDNHVDENGDLKCDVCGAQIQQVENPCDNHVDANSDSICDVCGAKLQDSDDPKPLDPTTDKPQNAVTEPTEHLATRVLHKVKVTETTNPFVVNGETDYKIVYTYSLQNQKAASFISRQIKLATDATIPVVEYTADIEFTSESKYIVLDVPELFASAGGTMPTDDIGETGYYIINIDKCVFISTNTDNGAQLAAISFLEHTIGFRQYSNDIVVYKKSGETLPSMEIIERPDYDYFVTGNKIASDGAYGMGYSGSLFCPVDGENWHNTMNYLPMSQYSSEHPLWYSNAGNELCYTAHGNAEEYQKLVEKMAELVLYWSDEYPERPYITITIEDAHRACTCDACNADREKYGADSGSLVKFMNAINRIVQAELDERAENGNPRPTELYLLFFAYFNMEKAPVVKDANGNYQPAAEEVICDPNVGAYIAPIYAAYNQSFYHENNASAKETIDGWQACSQNIYMWLYETNYSYYLYPINSWDTMLETFRYCQIAGAKYMFPEGQYNQAAVTHFSRVKEYFDARACFDVNLNFDELLDDFFANYFREGAEPMRKFFDELQAHLRYLETKYPAQVNGNIYNNMEVQEFWPKQLLDRWLDYCEQAYAAIEKYQTENPDLYKALYNNIKLETIFPRYALLRLHEGKYSTQTLDEMRHEFRDDVRACGITNIQENTSIETIFAAWGLL